MKRKIIGSMLMLVAFATAFAGPVKSKPRVFILDADRLQAHKMVVNKANVAYIALLNDADTALTWGPHSVMEKKHTPPSGSKHDYMSIAIYFWPDSSKPNGLPYINKDGQVNPEVHDYSDKEYMPVMCDKVYTLALAYYFSGNEKYAAYASRWLKVWFLDTATRMNPNLQYAQAVKGVNEGRGIGLIETRHFTKVVDAIGLLQASKSWTANDQKSMKQWFAQFLNWMQTSKNGKDEMNTENNHGTFYDMQRLSLALFIDSTALAKKVVNSAMTRLDKQMANDGSFPLELKRTLSFQYSTFNLEAYFGIAAMAEKIGMPIWTLTTPSGKSLQKGFDFLRPFITKKAVWKGEQIKPFSYSEAYSILFAATTKYGCADCVPSLYNTDSGTAEKLVENLLY